MTRRISDQISLAVAAADPAFTAAAVALAAQLRLPYWTDGGNPNEYAFILNYTRRDGEPLLQLEARGADAPGPLYVDFVGGQLGYRQRQAGHAREPLARAVGLKNRLLAPDVLDATGGLGRDAFMLARLGCRVTMLERAPVMAALLRDGLARAAADAGTAAVVERIDLIGADAVTYLAQLGEAQRPEVIYLDPMYPHRDKSALVKKEMRYLRSLVGDDLDAPALLAAARLVARRRVVVKRPRLADALAGPPPSSTLMGSTTRFDIYLPAILSAPHNAQDPLNTVTE